KLGDREEHTVALELRVADADVAHVVRAPLLEPDHVVRVVHDAHLVRFHVADAERRDARSVHSPYGTQLLLTCVARRRNSRPPPWSGSYQSRSRPCAHQVRFMLPADSRSISAVPPSAGKYQMPSTSSCAASTGPSSPRGPVTMFTTPPGTSEVSSTW